MSKNNKTYLVIYSSGEELQHKGFDTIDQAKTFAASINLAVGIFDYPKRKLLTELITIVDSYRGQVNDYIRENFPSEEDLAKQKIRFKNDSQSVAQFYLRKFLLILCAIVVSGFCNFYLGWHLKPLIGVSLAALFYGGSTLGYLVSWHVQTFSGRTPPEQLNEGILQVSYVLGTAFTVLSL